MILQINYVDVDVFIILCTYQSQARGRWGGGSGSSREFDCGVHPQVGDFDRTLCILSFNFIE